MRFLQYIQMLLLSGFTMTMTQYVPDASEQGLRTDITRQYIVYEDKSVILKMSPISQELPSRHFVYQVNVLAKLHDDGTRDELYIRDLMLWVTDAQNHDITGPKKLEINTPRGSFKDILFAVTPDSCHYHTRQNGTFEMLATYTYKSVNPHQQLVLNCYADLDIRGKQAIIHKQIKVNQKKVKLDKPSG